TDPASLFAWLLYDERANAPGAGRMPGEREASLRTEDAAERTKRRAGFPCSRGYGRHQTGQRAVIKPGCPSLLRQSPIPSTRYPMDTQIPLTAQAGFGKASHGLPFHPGGAGVAAPASTAPLRPRARFTRRGPALLAAWFLALAIPGMSEAWAQPAPPSGDSPIWDWRDHDPSRRETHER